MLEVDEMESVCGDASYALIDRDEWCLGGGVLGGGGGVEITDDTVEWRRRHPRQQWRGLSLVVGGLLKNCRVVPVCGSRSSSSCSN